MNFRSVRMSMLIVGLIATTFVALRAADPKAKGKGSDVPPSPGEIKFTAAPPKVQETFKQESGNSPIEVLGTAKLEGATMSIFAATVGIKGNNYQLTVGQDGQLLEKQLIGNRVEIKFTDLPRGVQDALKAEAPGAVAETVEKVTAGKRADYMMDVIDKKKVRYQLMFHDDGTLVSKTFDDGAEEAPDAKEAPKSNTKKK